MATSGIRVKSNETFVLHARIIMSTLRVCVREYSIVYRYYACITNTNAVQSSHGYTHTYARAREYKHRARPELMTRHDPVTTAQIDVLVQKYFFLHHL